MGSIHAEEFVIGQNFGNHEREMMDRFKWMVGPSYEFSGQFHAEEGFVVWQPIAAQNARPGAQLRLREAFDVEPAGAGVRCECEGCNAA